MSKVTLGLLQHACGTNPAANLKETRALAEQAAILKLLKWLTVILNMPKK